MNGQYRFVAVCALLALAAYGWGSLLSLAATRRRPEAGDAGLAGPTRIALGVALFLCVGGFAIALGVGSFAFLLGWQVLGGLLGLWTLSSGGRLQRLASLRVLASAAVFGLLFFLAMGASLDGPYNANDDGPAYLYLAQRLLSTGGLIDPFNTRRLNSYGGAELFQAIVLKVCGNSAGLGVEWVFFSLLLLALFVRSTRRPFAPVVLLLVGLGVVLVRPVGIWVNVAPTFSGAALTLALLGLLAGARRDAPEPWRFALSGLLLAGLFSLRLEFFVPAAVVLVATAARLLRGGRGLALAGTAVASCALGLAGWAAALQASSGTPLFPLFAGYWTQASQWKDPAIHTLGQYAQRFLAELAAARWAVIVIGTLLAAAATLAAAERLAPLRPDSYGGGEDRRRLFTLVALALGCLLTLVFETFTLSGAVMTDIGRYSAPSTLALLLYGLDLVWDLAVRAPRPAGLRLGAAGGGLALFLLALGTLPAGYGRALSSQARVGADLVGDRFGLVDHWAGQRPLYKKLNAAVPPGSRLLSAVELPGLLDMARFSFATLDNPGGTSPPPHLPLTGGPGPFVAYLRSLGYDGIVAISPRAQGLYNLPEAKADLTSGVYYYRASAAYTVDWAKLLGELNHSYRVVRVRTLEYVSFAHPTR